MKKLFPNRRLPGVKRPSLWEWWRGKPRQHRVVRFLTRHAPHHRLARVLLGATLRWDRRLYLLALISIPASYVLIGLTAATWPLGVPQRAINEVVAMGTTDAAPEEVKWVEYPTNRFIEAGRREDGSLDLVAMHKAWREAGLDANELALLRWELANHRATLLLRRAPELEAKLIADAKENIEVLVEEHEGVHHRLEDPSWLPTPDEDADNEESHVLSEEDRLADAETAKLAWEQEGRPRWSFLDDEALAVRTGSLNARMKALLAWNDEQPTRLDVPVPELLSAGFADGKAGSEWDVLRMLDGWRSRGLSSLQAEVALNLVDELLSPIDPQADAVEKKELAADLGKTASQIESRQMEWEGELASRMEEGPVHLSTQQIQQEERGWQDLASTLTPDLNLLPPPDGLTMALAKKELERVALAVGLRSLTLMPAEFESPSRMWKTAQMLAHANREIEALTGWKGPVLGLGGRVELTLAEPRDVYFASGLVVPSTEGRLQMITAWRSLSHEWFHALDVVAGQQARSFPSLDLLSDDSDWLTMPRRLPKVVSAMDALREEVDSPESAWTRAREKNESAYWQRMPEAMAFAFGALSRHRGNGLFGNRQLKLAHASYQEAMPTLADLDRFDDKFEALFRSLDGMDWTGKPEAGRDVVSREAGWLAQQFSRDTYR